jgi:hypothetical protein
VSYFPRLRKGPVRRHEPREHRTDELCGRHRSIPRLPPDRLAVGDEVSMNRRGQLDGQPDRLVVLDRVQFEFGHGSRFIPHKVRGRCRG